MNQAAVLFVCLGNICRSPLAEAAFRREAKAAGLEILIDSAGTGDWHVGRPPDPRARAEALDFIAAALQNLAALPDNIYKQSMADLCSFVVQRTY